MGIIPNHCSRLAYKPFYFIGFHGHQNALGHVCAKDVCIRRPWPEYDNYPICSTHCLAQFVYRRISFLKPANFESVLLRHGFNRYARAAIDPKN